MLHPEWQVTVLRNIMEADAKMLLLTELLQRVAGGSGPLSSGQPPGSTQDEGHKTRFKEDS